MPSESCDALIVGGGPAGLRAAELISNAGMRTILADRMRSVGRKFLVAGRGGLNLTHSEPLDSFCLRFGEPRERWKSLLTDFTPQDLRAWSAGLGIETFIGTSRRVFPMTKQAAPLLRRWIERLRAQGVSFRSQHQLTSFRRCKDGRWEVAFGHVTERITIFTKTIILALGGASWPQTGSDGAWTELLASAGIPVTPLAAANCGYEVDWPPGFLAIAEGRPLKNIEISAGSHRSTGELLITKYGLEGGALYQLSPVLRGMDQPTLNLDLKPTFTADQLAAKVGANPSMERAAEAWRLTPPMRELLRACGPFTSAAHAAEAAKSLPIRLLRPRPIAEAISTTGGVPWESLDENLMLRKCPGVFCAGEMVDWEAPTGGYLLQGCFSTGTRAARGAIAYLSRHERAK